METYTIKNYADAELVCSELNPTGHDFGGCPTVFLTYTSHGFEDTKDGRERFVCFDGLVSSWSEHRKFTLKVATCELMSTLDKLAAGVAYRREGLNLWINSQGATVNGGKTKAFKRDCEYAYKIQKTQYKGRSPYCLLEMLVTGFESWLLPAFEQQGWTKAA